jgi:hypothetical protein
MDGGMEGRRDGGIERDNTENSGRRYILKCNRIETCFECSQKRSSPPSDKVLLRKGETLRNEEDRAPGGGFCYERMKE